MRVSEAEAEDLVRIGTEEIKRQIAGRVLIIEDEPIIAMDLEAIVGDLGHSVVEIADTRDNAVSAALEHQPNLILADIQLADGSSGIDAVGEILSSFTVPVVFITAYPERLLTGKRPEPTYLITKPFTREQVAAAVSQALFFEKIVDPV
jgi:CheY-like chemotaxis protein